MRAGSFSVGDLALFLYYLAWFQDFVNMFGLLLERYRMLGVAVRRLVALTRGPADDASVAVGEPGQRAQPGDPEEPGESGDLLRLGPS